MYARQFVEVYPRELTEAQIHRTTPLTEAIADGQNWSYLFGQVAHDHLSGRGGKALSRSELNRYETWTQYTTAIEYELLTLPNVDEAAMRARNEFNFHTLNRSMLPLWKPIIGRGWRNENLRLRDITLAQNSLAIDGIMYFLLREDYARNRGEHYLFQSEMNNVNSRSTGLLQEYDEAITILEWLRGQPLGSTLVPAPAQFEHTNRRTNIDLLLVNSTAQRAAGAQCKSTYAAGGEDVDEERVTVLYGDRDLGNTRSLRIREGGPPVLRAWPGYVCARRVLDIDPATVPKLRFGADTRPIQGIKEEAAAALVSHPIDIRVLAKRIGNRLLPKF